MSRTSDDTRYILRKEVNFGCPICGEPYLSYHHFDPPWRVKHHDNPEGIIALCREHHDKADECEYSKKELKELKKNPIIKLEEIASKFDFFRKDAICFAGFMSYHVNNIVEIDGEKIIWFEKDEPGYNRLNLILKDGNMNPVLVMENNDWTVFNDNVYDIEYRHEGRILNVITKEQEANLQIKFDEMPLDHFIQKMRHEHPNLCFRERFFQVNPELVPIWRLTGKLIWGNFFIEINDNEIIDSRGNCGRGVILGIDRPTINLKKDGSLNFG